MALQRCAWYGLVCVWLIVAQSPQCRGETVTCTVTYLGTDATSTSRYFCICAEDPTECPSCVTEIVLVEGASNTLSCSTDDADSTSYNLDLIAPSADWRILVTQTEGKDDTFRLLNEDGDELPEGRSLSDTNLILVDIDLADDASDEFVIETVLVHVLDEFSIIDNGAATQQCSQRESTPFFSSYVYCGTKNRDKGSTTTACTAPDIDRSMASTIDLLIEYDFEAGKNLCPTSDTWMRVMRMYECLESSQTLVSKDKFEVTISCHVPPDNINDWQVEVNVKGRGIFALVNVELIALSSDSPQSLQSTITTTLMSTNGAKYAAGFPKVEPTAPLISPDEATSPMMTSSNVAEELSGSGTAAPAAAGSIVVIVLLLLAFFIVWYKRWYDRKREPSALGTQPSSRLNPTFDATDASQPEYASMTEGKSSALSGRSDSFQEHTYAELPHSDKPKDDSTGIIYDEAFDVDYNVLFSGKEQGDYHVYNLTGDTSSEFSSPQKANSAPLVGNGQAYTSIKTGKGGTVTEAQGGDQSYQALRKEGDDYTALHLGDGSPDTGPLDAKSSFKPMNDNYTSLVQDNDKGDKVSYETPRRSTLPSQEVEVGAHGGDQSYQHLRKEGDNYTALDLRDHDTPDLLDRTAPAELDNYSQLTQKKLIPPPSKAEDSNETPETYQALRKEGDDYKALHLGDDSPDTGPLDARNSFKPMNDNYTPLVQDNDKGAKESYKTPQRSTLPSQEVEVGAHGGDQSYQDLRKEENNYTALDLRDHDHDDTPDLLDRTAPTELDNYSQLTQKNSIPPPSKAEDSNETPETYQALRKEDNYETPQYRRALQKEDSYESPETYQALGKEDSYESPETYQALGKEGS